jgi:hypothetical protein
VTGAGGGEGEKKKEKKDGEDGVQITVMTGNYQEYYEQCSRWRTLVFCQF